eukprot:505400_1
MAQSQRHTATPKLSVKPTVTETNRTLELLPIIDQLDKYPENTMIHSDTFTLDDVTFIIRFYPRGNDSKSEYEAGDRIGLYLKIQNVKANDRRKVHMSLHHNGHLWSEFWRSLHLFRSDSTYGWPHAGVFSHSELKQNPNINLRVKLIHDPLFVSEIPSRTLEEQQIRMHVLSASDGDVTLMVKLPEYTDDLRPPPKQKRKLNEFLQHTDNSDGTEFNSDDGDKSDTESNEIKVNAIVLRSASNVFDLMLSNDMMEKREQKIEVKAKTLVDVKDMVYYMSTHKLKKTSNALNVIQLAHYYEMDRLFWECASMLLQNVSVQNFVQTIKTFDTFEIANGYDTLVEFAKKNAKELEETDDFNTLSHAFKCVVLNKSC